MKIYLGTKGLDMTWQEDFTETIKCHKCKGEARIMFVAFEDGDEGAGNYVSKLRENTESKGGYWPHDAIACAVYLCKDCFETTSILNQA